jgi:hypothetical protein
MAEPKRNPRLTQRLSTAVRERDWPGVAVELVIVMIGVFLGIEAANWNQARQDRAEEKRYYAQIVVDLRRDLHTLEGAEKRSRANDKAAEMVLDALDRGVPSQVGPSDFAKAIDFAGFLYLPSPSRRTYDELISTGNLGLLRDTKAKDAIAAYYEAFAELRQWDILLRQQQADYWSATAGILPRRVLQAALVGNDPNVSSAEAQAILNRARATPRLKDMLIGMAAHQARVPRDSIDLERKARTLIEELQPLSS